MKRDRSALSVFKLANATKIKIETECLKGYEIKEILGSGNHGTVFLGCLENNCKYAVKFIILPNDNKEMFDTYLKKANQEIEASKLFSENLIGPKFIDAWQCDNIIIIVSELWSGQLKVGSCIGIEMLEKLRKQIFKIHQLGYVHGDIFEKNILVKYNHNNNIEDITLSDFGTAQKIDDWKNPIWTAIVNYKFEKVSQASIYYDHYMKTKAFIYFITNKINEQQVINDPTYLDKATLWILYRNCNLVMPINWCIFCGNYASRMVETNNRIKICDNGKCELKLK